MRKIHSDFYKFEKQYVIILLSARRYPDSFLLFYEKATHY